MLGLLFRWLFNMLFTALCLLGPIALLLWVAFGKAWEGEALQHYLQSSRPTGWFQCRRHDLQGWIFKVKVPPWDIVDFILGKLYRIGEKDSDFRLLEAAYLRTLYHEALGVRSGGIFPTFFPHSGSFHAAYSHEGLEIQLLVVGLFKLHKTPARQRQKLIKFLEQLLVYGHEWSPRQWAWLQRFFSHPEIRGWSSETFKTFLAQERPHRPSQRQQEERQSLSKGGSSMSLPLIYRILGIQATGPVTDGEVRAAYLRRMRQVHPDKLEQYTLSEKEREARLREAQHIQQAFQTWKRHFAQSS